MKPTSAPAEHTQVAQPSTPHSRPSEPQTSSRGVLLVVSGLNPQVVTETVYALAVKRSPAFVPTEIHLITTAAGANAAVAALLGPSGTNQLLGLCAEHGLPAVNFTPEHIHVVTDALGEPLADIRTPADNEVAADFITELVRRFTADDAPTLHVSIAGGRKTQGFYLGYALSLFGRPHDELSHVLVSEPFERVPAFYYPTRDSALRTLADGTVVDCAQAEVSLASIPFVRLRYGLPTGLLKGGFTFNQTVDAARRVLEPPSLVLDLPHRRIQAGQVRVELTEPEMALLSVFARRLLAGLPPVAAPHKSLGDEEWGQWLSDERRRCYLRADLERDGTAGKRSANTTTTAEAAKASLEGESWSVIKSRLKAALVRALGPAAVHYQIRKVAGKPARFALPLPPHAVRYGTVP